MALNVLNFEFKADGNTVSIPKEWSHTGVVGSGDMEVLLKKKEQGGKTTITVNTPVSGFDEIWKKVLGKFVIDSQIGDVYIEINDNNSMPFIVATRLKQAFAEAKGGE